MENKTTIQVNHELTKEIMLDILTTAIEGGIGYWSILLNDDPKWEKASKQWKEEHNGETPCYCDSAYKVMENGDAIRLEDVDDGNIYELTMEKFLNGCKLYIEKTGKDIKKAMDESNFDAWDADAIIQYALFGEVIYG